MTYFCLTSATLVILFTVQTLAQSVVSYKSEIQLPMDMYTAESVLLKQGYFELEVRFEQSHYSLVFLDKDKIIARVNGQTVGKNSEEPKQPHPSIPVLGTILLLLPTTPTERGKSAAPAVAPQLPNLPWKATLRVYKSSSPDDKEVQFIFEERENSRQIHVYFRLFLKRLA